MDCSKIHKDLIFFIEGSLDEEKRKAVDEHLLICEDCSAFADMLKASLDVISQEKKVEEDKTFADRVIEGMKKEEAKTITLTGILRYAAAAAIIILGVFSGINIAKVTTVPGENKVSEFSDEVYYLNDMYQEPIESFFLLKYEDNE
ncbi:MAG: zf-HC2 domain-containing protein [Bacteroidales bacterium]|nr:zf-HC2 domain-containing protein [Bacteroidales bacterium]